MDKSYSDVGKIRPGEGKYDVVRGRSDTREGRVSERRHREPSSLERPFQEESLVDRMMSLW